MSSALNLLLATGSGEMVSESERFIVSDPLLSETQSSQCTALLLNFAGDEILLSGSYDDTIKVWAEDVGDWYCAASLSAHSSTVWSLAVAPGGSRLISGSSDCSIAIFKCYTAKEKKALFPDAESGR